MDIDEFLDKEVPLIEKEPIVTKELVEYQQILEKVNSCIERNELEQAENLYSKLWLKIKEEKFTWRQDLYDALIKTNKKLKESLNKFHQETIAKINSIHTLISKTRSSLKEEKMESALTAYSEIMAIYNRIPRLFLREKKTIYINEILPLHKGLKEKIEGTFFHNFNSKQSKINNLIHSTKTELQKNNIKEAVKFYTDCLNLYSTLPDGFFLQKIELSNKILELYREISIILEISDLKSRLKLRPGEKVSEKVVEEKISAKPIQHKRPALPEIPAPAKKPEKPSRIEKLKKLPVKTPESIKITKKPGLKEELVKRKLDRALFKLNKGHIKGAGKDLQDVLRIEPDNEKAKRLLEEVSKKIQFIEKTHKIAKPLEKPKHKPIKIVKKEGLKEELVKRKLDRALFKLNKGYIKGAGKDLQDVLRIEPDNEKAKRLLERIK